MNTHSRQRLVIVGAGGHGREIYALVESLTKAGADGMGRPCSYDVVGFVDDGDVRADLLERLGVPLLGGVVDALQLPSDTRYVIGIGSGRLRRRLAAVLDHAGLVAATLVAPSAEVGPDVRLEPGSVIFGQATVTTNITVAAHAHVGRGAAIGHDSELGAYSTVMPLASVSGNVVVGAEATIGTNAAVIQGLSIGEAAYVGAGACVTRDVAAGVTVAGVPARLLHQG